MNGNTMKKDEDALIQIIFFIMKVKMMFLIEDIKKDFTLDFQKALLKVSSKDQLNLNMLEFKKELKKEYMMDLILDLTKDSKLVFDEYLEMLETEI